MAKKQSSKRKPKKPAYATFSERELGLIYLALFNLALDCIMEDFLNGNEEN